MSKRNKDPWVRTIDVSDPVLHKKGYTLYKVTSKVFPRNSVEAVTEVTVWKRYNDFKKLHKALNAIHQSLYLKGSFPPFAKARLFGRFDKDVIEERRQSALQLLQFASNHPALFTSQVFVKFFEDSHSVDSNAFLKDSQEKSDENISKIPTLEPIINVQNSKICNQENSSESDNKEQANILGGTWQHHQLPDNLSLGSQCTEDDEDDRTTFTDDDSTASRPSINLADFDPLFKSTSDDTSFNNEFTKQNNVCSNWLLSALEACSITDSDKDPENIIEFPTPFSDVESVDDVITPSNESQPLNYVNSDSKTEHFPLDNPPPSEEPSVVKEFDPLSSNDISVFDMEDDFYNCDDFATTPTSYKNELLRRPSFIMHASKFVIHAQEAESKASYTEAFEAYKKAIDILLQGIQKDCQSDLKDAVRRKVMLYLMRAEEIYENKLPKENDGKSEVQSSHVIVDKLSVLKGSMQDLNRYKVLGILGKVLLVLDISNNSTYVIKALYKSSSPRHFDSPHIVPQNIPFMVKLVRIYESSYAIFLVLEHATGGRLWDYVSSFLQRSPVSPSNDNTYLYVDHKNKAATCNVYSGKKISDSDKRINANLMDSDLTPSENCPHSYVALFKKYAASVNEETVALAKYNTVPQGSFNNNSINVDETSQRSSSRVEHEEKLQSTRKRLSSSTGSLEAALSQKTCFIEAFDAMDEIVFNSSKKLHHLPESCVYLWVAEMVIALDSLHRLGITWVDFNPDNILLGAEGIVKPTNVIFYLLSNVTGMMLMSK